MFFWLVFCGVAALEYEEDLVWQLNKENFRDALDYQKKILVLFWSGSDKESSDHYADLKKTASKLNEQLLRVGSVNCDNEKELCERYVKSGEKLYYFINSEPVEYNGPVDASGMSKWLSLRNKSELRVINAGENFKELIEKRRSSLVFCGDPNAKQYETLQNLSLAFHSVKFFIAKNSTASICSRKSSVYLNRGGDFYEFTDVFTYENMEAFFKAHKPAKVHDFDDSAAEQIFDHKQVTFFFFRRELDKTKYQVDLEKLADRYKEHFFFVFTDLVLKKNGKKLANVLGIKSEDQPLAVILDPKRLFSKYKISSISLKDLSNFIDKYLDNQLEPYLRSEKVPEKPMENKVLKIVGDNHEQVIKDKDKDVIVLYYTTNHEECSKFIPIFEKLALNYEIVEDIVMAKMDIVLNDAKGLAIKDIPMIKIYPRHNKSGILYVGELNMFSVQKFVSAHYRPKQTDL